MAKKAKKKKNEHKVSKVKDYKEVLYKDHDRSFMGHVYDPNAPLYDSKGKEKKETLAFFTRLNLSNREKNFMAKSCGTARFVYNHALSVMKENIKENANLPKENRKYKSLMDLKKEFNVYKKTQFPWMYETGKDANQEPFSNLEKALKSFFKGITEFPTYKKKFDHDSFYISNDKFAISENGKKIRIPRLGEVKLEENALFLKGQKILSATVSRKANEYYISISYEIKDKKKRVKRGEGKEKKERYDSKREIKDLELKAKKKEIVGIDWGVSTFLTTSENDQYASIKWYQEAQSRLKGLQRKLSRQYEMYKKDKKKDDSIELKDRKNYNRTKIKVSKLHAEIAFKRQDYLHKISSKLTREYKTIVVEDLALANLAKNHSLAKHVLNTGMGELVRQLVYKARREDTTVIKVDRWYPSSKTCSNCGHVHDNLALNDREYNCSHCHSVIDRDLNAALNIKRVGKIILSNYINNCGAASANYACGDRVSPKVEKSSEALVVEARNSLMSNFGLVE